MIDGCQGRAGWQIVEGKWTDDVVAFEGFSRTQALKGTRWKTKQMEKSTVAPAFLFILFPSPSPLLLNVRKWGWGGPPLLSACPSSMAFGWDAG